MSSIQNMSNSNPFWRTDSLLQNRFGADHPDDLQVIVHDGGPRLSSATPELMWVKVTGKSGIAFRGQLLNTPENLESVGLGSEILFLVLPRVEHPFRVTEGYLEQRNNWRITACDRCGFSELFDAPSDLIAKIFPDVGPEGSVEMFTTFCPLCGGVQGVEWSGAVSAQKEIGRKWWQVWK